MKHIDSKNPPSSVTYIYGLYDPRQLVDGELDMIRYVGKADDPQDRLRQHVYVAFRKEVKTPVYYWIRKLSKEGVTPQILILHEVPMGSWQGTEQNVIDVMFDEGHDLLNLAEGGDGFTSEEFKRMWADEEIRAKQIAGLKKAHGTPEARKAAGERIKNQWADPKVRAKNIAGLKKTKGMPEARKAASEKAKESWSDSGVRMKQIARMKEAKRTPEARKVASEKAKKAWAAKE